METTTKRPEITPETKVTVYNEFGGSLSYPTERGTRFMPVDSYREVEVKELSDLIGSFGGRGAFEKGFLVIKDDRVKEYLGLEMNRKYELNKDEIKELLLSHDMPKIEEFLQFCSDETLEKCIRTAVDIPLKDLNIANLIRAYSGVNVIDAIQEKMEVAAAETGVRQRVDGVAPADPAAARGRKTVQ